MAFVVDGAEWHFNGWSSEEISTSISTLIERVWIARERSEIVWVGDSLQTQSVFEDCDIWSLFSHSSPVNLPKELAQELAGWLGNAPRYLDEEWPEGMEECQIGVDDELPRDNPDQAWAHHSVRSGRPVACLSIRRSGLHKTESSKGIALVHWVVDEKTCRTFWRASLDLGGGREEAMERLAPHAYPDLYFFAGIWQGLRSFGGGYLAIRHELQRYLAGLDDHGAWAFTFPPPALEINEGAGPDADAKPSNQIIESRFRRLGLVMAPENPDVYRDSKCRQTREIRLGDKTLYCEWHGKLEAHRNRIHVHPPVPLSGNKVIIAFFHEHLPLPG